MNRLFASFAAGAVAGVVDVIPMIVLETSRAAMVAAFVHWLLLGFVITYLRLGLPGWLKGLLVGAAFSVPVIATLFESDASAVPQVAVMSALLGSALGFASSRVRLLREPPSPSTAR